MPFDRVEEVLVGALRDMDARGVSKRAENVITEVVPPQEGRGPRYRLAGFGDRLFLRMNSNGYLGLALHDHVRSAEENAVANFGAGPGAVRFISGTWAPHIELEQRLAAFHGRPTGMIFSSAYATTMGVLPPLVTSETLLVSDQLNHNSIINAMRLSRPGVKQVYKHLDLEQLDSILAGGAKSWRRAVIVTDGIFSMRGDHAPVDRIMDIARAHDSAYPENVIVMVDDSHGVGAFGKSGRGVEEYCGGPPADLLVATLGKAFGVNGGYVVGSRVLIDYLRETSPFYIYSNPITPGEAAAASAAIHIVDSAAGRSMLDHLRAVTAQFEDGLATRGWETIPGEHPVVPLMVRDTERTSALVAHLKDCDILATGLNFPVVPRGDEEIRFQVCADHTPMDIDEALSGLDSFAG